MKTVVFGGTFNPIHLSHIEIIRNVADMPGVEKVLVIPTRVPPHKVCADLACDADRLEMCRAATKDIPKTIVSDIELLRSGKSYTYDTLKQLREEMPGAEFALVCGGDMIVTFSEWYRYRDILNSAEIFAVRRVGIDEEQFDNAVRDLLNAGGRVTVLKTRLPAISSTDIRENRNNLKFLQQYLPNCVLKYITENNLYCEADK